MRFPVFIIWCLVSFLSAWGQEADSVRLRTGEVLTGRVVFRNGQVVVLQAEDGSRYQFPAGDVQSVSVAAPAPEGARGMKITMETGETYRGEVLAENERVVMLRLADGSRMQIRREEIAAMEPDAFTAIDRSDALPVVEASPGGQFGMMIEVGGGTSFSRNSYGWVPALQAAWVLGVRDVAWAGTFAGVGIGYNLCAANKSGEGAINLLPLFARLHSTIGRHVTAPYVELDAGYAFSFHPDMSGGMLLRLSVGVTRRFSSRTAFYAGVYGGLQGLSGDLRDIDPWGDYFTYHGHTITQQAGVKVALRF